MSGKSKAFKMAMAGFSLLTLSSILYAGVIKADRIQGEVIGYMLATADNDSLEFEVLVPNAYDIVVDELLDFDITVSHDPGKKLRGTVPVTVEVRDGSGELVKRIRLIARLKTFATIACATRNIRRGEKIVSGDVEMKRMEVSRLKEFVTSPSALEGLMAKKYIRAGNAMSSSIVRPVYVVLRGDRVNIEIHQGSVNLRTTGIAREDGGTGDSIKVFVEMTKSVITGKIVDKETIIVSGA